MKTTIFKFGLTLAFGAFLCISCDNDNDDNGTPDLESTKLYASNNTDGNVIIYDMVSGQATTLTTTATAAEGIYYDATTDEIIQASRSANQLEVYSAISTYLIDAAISVSLSSSSDATSPRDIAVNDNFVIVADNSDVDANPDTADGRLFIYTRSNGSLTLRNTVTTDFALWGIELIGNNLYAVVDKTNKLAVYTNFTAMNTTNATVSATKTIAIEGMVRTHGLAYDKGTMILTDVGDAASDTDGAFHIITNFDAKFNAVSNGDIMAVANNQVRVSGASTALGNPVAAEYDAASKTIFIAEAVNGGGRVLAFSNADAGGNITPSMNVALSKASSLYFYTNQ